MDDDVRCPKCNAVVSISVDVDRDDPEVEWVGYICPNCTPKEGEIVSVNKEVPPIGQEEQTEEDWLCCCDVLPDYVAHIPAGHIRPIAGAEVWIDAYGVHMSRERFKELHGVDPVPAWAAIKAYLKKYGKGVRKATEE